MRQRAARRWTRARLARESGVSVVYLKLLEGGLNPSTGKPPSPSSEILWRIARALGGGDEQQTAFRYLELYEAAGYFFGRSHAELLASGRRLGWWA